MAFSSFIKARETPRTMRGVRKRQSTDEGEEDTDKEGEKHKGKHTEINQEIKNTDTNEQEGTNMRTREQETRNQRTERMKKKLRDE